MKLSSHIVRGSLLSVAASAASVDLDISIQKSYAIVKVPLGTPPVEYKLFFDTGSSTLWVIDKTCTATQCPEGSGTKRARYDGAASSTSFEDHNIMETIDYSGGSVTGFLASDIATFGGLNFRQNFTSLTKSTWASLGADGFLGLASSSIAFPNTTSIFENMMLQGHADAPRFGIYLGTALTTMENDSPANNGVLTLGSSKETEFASEPVRFVDISSPFGVYKMPFQSLNITHAAPGNASADANLSWKGSLIFDTGAASISIPEDQIKQMYAATPWTYEELMSGTRPLCSDFTDAWEVSFTVGPADAPQTFSVKGSKLASPGYQDDEHCFPPFDSWDSQNVILGNLWLRNFYSVFDYSSLKQEEWKVRVGLAPLKDEFVPKVKA